MSSYIVSDKEVILIAAISLANQYDNIKIDEIKAVGVFTQAQELLDANYVGVNARYNEEGTEKINWNYFTKQTGDLDYWILAECCNNLLKEFTIVEKLKICQHLAYQSCDSETWDNSRAKKIINGCTSKLICELPGYEAASWGID